MVVAKKFRMLAQEVVCRAGLALIVPPGILCMHPAQRSALHPGFEIIACRGYLARSCVYIGTPGVQFVRLYLPGHGAMYILVRYQMRTISPWLRPVSVISSTNQSSLVEIYTKRPKQVFANLSGEHLLGQHSIVEVCVAYGRKDMTCDCDYDDWAADQNTSWSDWMALKSTPGRNLGMKSSPALTSHRKNAMVQPSSSSLAKSYRASKVEVSPSVKIRTAHQSTSADAERMTYSYLRTLTPFLRLV
jgi:hypothetical protein